MQGTGVASLVWEAPTHSEAAKPGRHNYWARVPRAHALQQEKPLQQAGQAPQPQSGPSLPQLEKAHAQQWRPSAAIKEERNTSLKKEVTK